MTGLPSRVPKSCCWTPGFCFEEVCAQSNPPMAAKKTITYAFDTGLVIMAKSVLRDGGFVMGANSSIRGCGSIPVRTGRQHEADLGGGRCTRPRATMPSH